MGFQWGRVVRVFGVGLLVLAAAGCRVSANFHTVDDGKLYRSAQLTESELHDAIKKYGIKTVVNLRGLNPGKDWYDAEARATAEHSVALVSISMSAKTIPTRQNLLKLLDTYRSGEYPMLVHCEGGADRTGEAAAIYQMEYMGLSRQEALESLTFKYLHIQERMPAKRYFIGEVYQGEAWARESYDPCVTSYNYFDQAANCPN